ncbi:MAG: 6-bladed beta-propeller [Muribaculaceae bacterium]|nr:6-bladed beta-propeller [Muribaculaceae bacterium]
MRNNIIILGAFAYMFVVGSCGPRGKSIADYSDSPVSDTLFISTDIGNYSRIMNYADTIHFVILKEDENTMYSDINRVIDAYGRYFILDMSGSRKVVAFDYNGNPLTSYGKRGNGPGEFVFPWAMDVDSNFVYVLDVSQRKVISYTHDGAYVSERKLPFFPGSFIALDNGDFLFNLDPNDESGFQLCKTDSLMNPLEYMIPYPDNCVGGWVTNDLFRRKDETITYYQSPYDTIYDLNKAGNIVARHALEFEDGPISEEAKLDYIKAEGDGLLNKGMQLLNNPVSLPNGIIVSEIYRDLKKYTVLNMGTSFSGGKIFDDNVSAFDIITPCSVDRNGNLISFIDKDIASKCNDYQMLPDSIKSALDEGNRVLMIQSFNP